jgi:DNA-binding response OmpR family regulator
VATGTPLVAAVNSDTAFLHLLDTILADAGFDTLLLQSGDITYDTIKKHGPAVVILDIDGEAPAAGWRLVDLLLLDPATAQMPLIICSVADQTLVDRAPKLQATGCVVIEKPFTIDELLKQVRARLERRPPSAGG